MLFARLFGSVLLGLVLLGLGYEQEDPPSNPLEPNLAPRVAPLAPSATGTRDTLRPSVEAGNPLILNLPTELESRTVDRYALIRGPALSGVAGYSFTWITRSVEPGTYDVLLRANHPDASPDTLVLHVEVQQ